MNICLRMSVILVLLGLGVQSLLYSQNLSSNVDTTFENYMNKAWQEIQEADMSDSLQIIYAKEFYEYFQKNPTTETGQNAIRSSFMMWGNTRTSDHVEKVLQTLDYDSKTWGNIIFTLGNLLSQDEHKKLMEYLSENLTEPRGKSEAILSLLRTELSEDDPNEEHSIDLAQKLVEINATDFHVEQGLGYLHEFESLNIGQKAPDFTARTIDGQEISISKFKGQFVLLEFWATWCGPCIPEIPHLKKLHNRYQDDNFSIVGISLDRDKDALVKFINEREIEWFQIYVENGWKSEIPRLFNVAGIPRMYLIGPEGNIVARDLRGKEMVTKIDQLVSEYSN